MENGLDMDYSSRCSYTLENGEEILNALNRLIEVATPTEIYSVTDIGPIGSSGNGISDEDLIEHIKKSENHSNYYSIVSNVSEPIMDMGLGEAILIAIFHHKDVLLKDLM